MNRHLSPFAPPPGLEPELSEPKSEVLPLHHGGLSHRWIVGHPPLCPGTATIIACHPGFRRTVAAGDPPSGSSGPLPPCRAGAQHARVTRVAAGLRQLVSMVLVAGPDPAVSATPVTREAGTCRRESRERSGSHRPAGMRKRSPSRFHRPGSG